MKHDIFPLPEITYPLYVDTLGKLIVLGYDMSFNCSTHLCGHHYEINLVKLARHLGRDHGSLDRDLRPHFRCRKCAAAGRRGEKFSFVLHPPAGRKSEIASRPDAFSQAVQQQA